MASHHLPISRVACSPPCSGGRSSSGTPIELTAVTYQDIRVSSSLCLNRSAVTISGYGCSPKRSRTGTFARDGCRATKPVGRSQRRETLVSTECEHPQSSCPSTLGDVCSVRRCRLHGERSSFGQVLNLGLGASCRLCGVSRLQRDLNTTSDMPPLGTGLSWVDGLFANKLMQLFVGALGFCGCAALLLLEHRNVLSMIERPAWVQVPDISIRAPYLR